MNILQNVVVTLPDHNSLKHIDDYKQEIIALEFSDYFVSLLQHYHQQRKGKKFLKL